MQSANTYKASQQTLQKAEERKAFVIKGIFERRFRFLTLDAGSYGSLR